MNGNALIVSFSAVLLVSAPLVGSLRPPTTPSSFKVATWNVRSGMGIAGFSAPAFDHTTINCSDRSKPVNAWAVGLPQRELKALAADPSIVALAVQEAWHCGQPSHLNAELGFRAISREQEGVALAARHGIRGEWVYHRIDSKHNRWLVGGQVCLTASCEQTIGMYSTHLGGESGDDLVRQTRAILDFLARQPSPHLFMGDLNVFTIDRWNPRAPCTNEDTGPRRQALALIDDAGYIDAWKATQRGEGWTGMAGRRGCGRPEGNAYKRVDYVFVKGLTPRSSARFAVAAPGADAPSDHAGVIATVTAGSETTVR